ncbi:hypothetical protein ACSQ67_018963 [Phaseolus vulgaris]
MAKVFCDFRFLLLVAAGVFIYIQMRLFATQSGYADRLAAAIEAENHCTSQMRSLIDQISLQQGRIVAFEEERKRLEQECGQMKSLVQDLERKDLQRLTDKMQVPVAAVVVITCNRADYLERTINSVLNQELLQKTYNPVIIFHWTRISQCGVECKFSPFFLKAIGMSMSSIGPELETILPRENSFFGARLDSWLCLRALLGSTPFLFFLKYQRPISSRFPLFVSQDGSDPDVKSKALSYDQLSYMQVLCTNIISLMQHLDFEPVQTERPGEIIAYYKIASHYKWALDVLFYKHNFSRVIILEDDMDIAPDFFDYFEAAATLLDKDKSIMAVSSWNDNGQKQFVHDSYELYRSDFFPGLGWMLVRSIWDELSPKWPKAYPWDDWLRLKENHKGRQFIRPEVCRTYNFGEHGSSFGLFFKKYLEPIKLNDVKVHTLYEQY